MEKSEGKVSLLDRLWSNLIDRRGFRQEMENVDDEVQEEWKAEWQTYIDEHDRQKAESLVSAAELGALVKALKLIATAEDIYHCTKCGWMGDKPKWTGMQYEEDAVCPDEECAKDTGHNLVDEISSDEIADQALAHARAILGVGDE